MLRPICSIKAENPKVMVTKRKLQVSGKHAAPEVKKTTVLQQIILFIKKRPTFIDIPASVEIMTLACKLK